MKQKMQHSILLFLIVINIFFTSTYSFAQDHHHDHNNHGPSKSMIEIMRGMDQDLHKLTSAIMVEDYPAITSAAHDIAFHPGIDPEDLHKIFDRLSEQKEAFIACDTAVHTLAKETADAAKLQNMDMVLDKYTAMLKKAVECHKNFR